MLLFLEKLSFERKQIMLWGGFNLNLLNYSTPRKVTQFIDEICTKYFIPYINLPKRITRKLETLIDNVCYNKIIFHSIAGNIITGISDHLIQFLIEPSTLSKIMEKPISHITALSISIRETFKMRLSILTRRNY